VDRQQGAVLQLEGLAQGQPFTITKLLCCKMFETKWKYNDLAQQIFTDFKKVYVTRKLLHNTEF
jgi:hypothetical protein